MAFTEDLSVFTSTSDFGVQATLAGVLVTAIVDAPGSTDFEGNVTTEPSALIEASAGAAVDDSFVLDAGDLPSQLAQLAGSYVVRSVLAEPPDGAFSRLVLARVS